MHEVEMLREQLGSALTGQEDLEKKSSAADQRCSELTQELEVGTKLCHFWNISIMCKFFMLYRQTETLSCFFSYFRVKWFCNIISCLYMGFVQGSKESLFTMQLQQVTNLQLFHTMLTASFLTFNNRGDSPRGLYSYFCTGVNVVNLQFIIVFISYWFS